MGWIVDLLKQTYAEWSEDRVPRLAAALAYYTTFSLAPVLIVAIAVAGLVFGQDAARGQIVAQLSSLLGADSAKAIQELLKSASEPGKSLIASAIGVVTFRVDKPGLAWERWQAK